MWPLSREHYRATSLTAATAAWRTQPIRDFEADPDEVLAATQRARAPAPGAPRLPLDPGRWRAPASLWSALRRRRTVRDFAARPLALREVARLLVPAATVTGEVPLAGTPGLSQRLRAWPSAGGLYPIEVHALVRTAGPGLPAGAWRLDPLGAGGPALEGLPGVDARAALEAAAPSGLATGASRGEPGAAPLALVLTAVADRTLRKYGERGYRFLFLDAGHLAQNITLAAQALGLGVCPVGGFCEDALARAMALPEGEWVVHVLLVGAPAP